MSYIITDGKIDAVKVEQSQIYDVDLGFHKFCGAVIYNDTNKTYRISPPIINAVSDFLPEDGLKEYDSIENAVESIENAFTLAKKFYQTFWYDSVIKDRVGDEREGRKRVSRVKLYDRRYPKTPMIIK